MGRRQRGPAKEHAGFSMSGIVVGSFGVEERCSPLSRRVRP